MLFGSGKIPGVKSFCQLLNPIERAPFASNVRPPVTNKDLFRMDLELQMQVDLFIIFFYFDHFVTYLAHSTFVSITHHVCIVFSWMSKKGLVHQQVRD